MGYIQSMRYVELQATSHFSFLRGASSCEELFSQANVCGAEALAIADRNSAAGIVRAWEASKATGIRLIFGCRLDLIDGTGLLVYPTDRNAYSRLCRLLSVGKRRAGKAKCNIDWADVGDHAEGLIGSSCRTRRTTCAPPKRCQVIRRPQGRFGDDGARALIPNRRKGPAWDT